MKHLLSLLRAMHLFAHSAHNLCSGQTFHEDHAFFGGLYEAFSDDYDDLAERLIGLFGTDHMNLNEILASAQKLLEGCPSNKVTDNKVFYVHQLKYEEALQAEVEHICHIKGISQGVIQLLGDMANKSEMRVYKINQRLK